MLNLDELDFNRLAVLAGEIRDIETGEIDISDESLKLLTDEFDTLSGVKYWRNKCYNLQSKLEEVEKNGEKEEKHIDGTGGRNETNKDKMQITKEHVQDSK